MNRKKIKIIRGKGSALVQLNRQKDMDFKIIPVKTMA